MSEVRRDVLRSLGVRLDFASRDAASYAVRHWHYSRRMPGGKRVYIGVWEDDEFVGAIIMIVSFADEEAGHVGRIYQALNWIYTGETTQSPIVRVFGQPRHWRTLFTKYGTPQPQNNKRSLAWLRANVDPNVEMVDVAPKHRYVLPLTRSLRRRVLRDAKPYPRCVRVKSAARQRRRAVRSEAS